MHLQWQFFENLNEIVYVSEIETESLVYMNARLRKVLGIDDSKEYIGKKCYQVLQGLSRPCDFCTNHLLKENEFYEWTYKNPILNRSYLIKDTVFKYEGKKYRLEIAIDIDSEKVQLNSYYFANTDEIIKNCMENMNSSADPNETIDNLLKFIGEKFLCERSYIFERNKNNCFDNTYEWCKKGIQPQKDLLQNEPEETISWWLELFENKQIVVIEDIEEIKDKYPLAYAALKPQDIHSLVTGPIYSGDDIIGFIGVDNPDRKMLTILKTLLKLVGYFVQPIFKRRDLLNELETINSRDTLTGALNKNALMDYCSPEVNKYDNLGVIYCDVSGLRIINNEKGYDVGDRVIMECYGLIHKTLKTDMIYRTGGDEFVVFIPNLCKKQFKNIADNLKNVVKVSKSHMHIGYSWSDQMPIDVQALIVKANKYMFKNKQEHYFTTKVLEKNQYDNNEFEYQKTEEISNSTSKFIKFISENNFDPEALFNSVTFRNTSSYLYFGDLQSNNFYISDNMRDTFGFKDNIVPNLLVEWENRISTKEDLELYRHDLSEIISQKKTIHDLRYKVKDFEGNNIWIRCCGIIKWNEDKTIPLFFSGRVSCQDKDFVVDAITNFPREHAAIAKINELCKISDHMYIIGFCLNNFTEINETKGRYFGNLILQHIANRLYNRFSSRVSFFRLDGMRFMGIVSPTCKETVDDIVEKMREIIEQEYRTADISVRHPCAFGVLNYNDENESAQMVLENTITLILAAKTLPDAKYIEHSPENVRRMKEMANMALRLGQEVANNMKNFRIVVQPIVTANGNEPIKGEALLRWKYDGQNVSPAVFIPLLEKGKMILPVGKWVFEQVVRTCKRILSFEPRFTMSFNVSYLQIMDDDFIRFVEQTLKKYRMDGSHFIAELTETHFDENPEKLKEFVDGCKKIGIQIALDDFGNGYSSLGLLLKYPATVVKLDKSLLTELTGSEEKMYFISSIVYACHQFGKTVCVEGVETEEEDRIVKNTGCDMIQGYFHYKPVEISELYEILAERNK